MAEVNLWQLITTVADPKRDLSDGEQCRAIKEAVVCRPPCFPTELSLRVENSDWTVRLFDHEDHDQWVEITVRFDGTVMVTRARKQHDIYETRSITF